MSLKLIYFLDKQQATGSTMYKQISCICNTDDKPKPSPSNIPSNFNDFQSSSRENREF